MPKFEVVDTIPAAYRKVEFKGGTNGKCYLTADGDVYKHFGYPYPYDYELGVLSDAESDTFAFPTTVVYLGSKDPINLKGYRMPLEQGWTFDKLNTKTKMEILLNASRIVEDEALRLAKESGIVLEDVNNGNVVFRRNNTFGIYDTDLYYVHPNEETYEDAKQTMKEWNDYMLHNLGVNMDAFYSDTLNLHTELAIDSGKYRASELMEEIMTEMRTQGRIDPITLEDFNQGMRLIRRP